METETVLIASVAINIILVATLSILWKAISPYVSIIGTKTRGIEMYLYEKRKNILPNKATRIFKM